ncbi:MAG: TIR domain-containing protein [Acidobacteriota bacterium]
MLATSSTQSGVPSLGPRDSWGRASASGFISEQKELRISTLDDVTMLATLPQPAFSVRRDKLLKSIISSDAEAPHDYVTVRADLWAGRCWSRNQRDVDELLDSLNSQGYIRLHQREKGSTNRYLNICGAGREHVEQVGAEARAHLDMNMKESSADPRSVWVVHGRNDAAKEAMFQFLTSVELHPIEWAQAVALTREGSPHIGTVLDRAFSEAQAVVVLLTGDDEVRLRQVFHKPDENVEEREVRFQARPNVLFEAGMAFGRDPLRTVLVQVGPVKSFSNVSGRHIVGMTNAPDKRRDLVNRLKAAGCAVNESGVRWLSAGDFDAALPAPEVASTTTPEIPDMRGHPLRVLKCLSDHPDVTRGYLVNSLLIADAKVEYVLDELEDRKLVTKCSFIDRESEYRLTKEGRALLVRMGEL